VAHQKEVYGEKSYFWLRERELLAPITYGSDYSELDLVEEDVIIGVFTMGHISHIYAIAYS